MGKVVGFTHTHNFTADGTNDAGAEAGARGHEAEFQKATDDYAEAQSAILDVASEQSGPDRRRSGDMDLDYPVLPMDDRGKALAMARG